MGGSLVCVTPEYRWRQSERPVTDARESMRGGAVMLARSSLHWQTFGVPVRDRTAAAARVTAATVVESTWLRTPAQPPEVVEQRVEASRLPGHGKRYAETALELGFSVEAVWGQGIVGRATELLDSYSLRARWTDGPSGRYPLVVGLWINGQAAGAWVRVGDRVTKLAGVSAIEEILRTVALAGRST